MASTCAFSLVASCNFTPKAANFTSTAATIAVALPRDSSAAAFDARAASRESISGFTLT